MPRLLLLLLFTLAAYAVAEDEKRYNASMCQKSFPCGANINIRYPFFLANATMTIDEYPAIAIDGSYCGYPGMAIACDEKAGRATLQLKGDNYTVLDINYDKHTVTVVDADVLDAGDCPRVKHNVTVPDGTWLNLSNDTANENLVFFFDCAFTAGIPRPPPVFPPINCSDFRGREGTSSFVAAEPDVPPRNDMARACNAVITIPVLKSLLRSDEYLPRLYDDGYGKVLKQGFQLTWDPSAGPCHDCEESHGQCSYNQTGGFLGCLCSDGRVRNPGCGKSRKLFLLYKHTWI